MKNSTPVTNIMKTKLAVKGGILKNRIAKMKIGTRVTE